MVPTPLSSSCSLFWTRASRKSIGVLLFNKSKKFCEWLRSPTPLSLRDECKNSPSSLTFRCPISETFIFVAKCWLPCDECPRFIEPTMRWASSKSWQSSVNMDVAPNAWWHLRRLPNCTSRIMLTSNQHCCPSFGHWTTLVVGSAEVIVCAGIVMGVSCDCRRLCDWLLSMSGSFTDELSRAGLEGMLWALVFLVTDGKLWDLFFRRLELTMSAALLWTMSSQPGARVGKDVHYMIERKRNKKLVRDHFVC